MKLLKFIKIMFFLTTMALVYVHLQMQIFDLAYQAKIKETKIQDLSDDNGTVHINILRLKSANYLGTELLDEGSDLEFIRNDRILSMVALGQESERSEKHIPSSVKKSTNPLLELISLVNSQAEAKVFDKR